MKILFIIPYIPFPLNSGGNQAFFNMVDYLRHKMDVSILLQVQYASEAYDISKLKEIWDNVTFFVFTKKDDKQPKVHHPFYYKWLIKTKQSIERKIRRQIIPENIVFTPDFIRQESTLSTSIFKELDVDYIKYVTEVATYGFDIIQVEFYKLISLGYLLPSNTQTIFVHHEIRYIRNENEMQLFPRITKSDQLIYHIAKDFERFALQHYKHIITLTEIDRQILTKFLGQNNRIYTSPAVIQTDMDTPPQFIPCTSNRLTFVGSETHYPNLDALIWFCEEIAPYLRKQNVTCTLQVVCKWKTHIRELQHSCPEMETVGYIKDLPSFLKGSIALVPIRIGSGMRMKILEAVSADIPFITTTKGVEGIDLLDKEEYLKADSATEFADAIITLSQNTELQEKLVRQAKSKMKDIYNPSNMLEQRFNIYKQILNEPNK